MRYFDYNATAPLHPAARGAWLEAADVLWHNASSPYRAAARARNALELARVRVAERFGCAPERVVFTAGATEGNNAVLRHFAGRGVAVSTVEHPSVVDAARALCPSRLIEVPAEPTGQVQPMCIGEALVEPGRPGLFSLMAANNETGVIQPWRDALRLCRQAAVAFHCDAVQWIGRMPLKGLADCDFVTTSGHKFGGPKGTGFILIPENASFAVQHGGGQEHGHRGGTEALPSILAMVAALEAVDDTIGSCGSAGRDACLASIVDSVPDVRTVGSGADRLWNTAMLIMPRHANTRWVSRLDRAGFQVSTGSACATGKEGPSHVLAAMGYEADAARRAIRLSSGPDTTVEDWLALAQAIAAVWRDLESEDAASDVIDLG